jgi:hypothetical protein
VYLPDIERMASKVSVPITSRGAYDCLLRAALMAEKAFGRPCAVGMLHDIADAIENDRTPKSLIT